MLMNIRIKKGMITDLVYIQNKQKSLDFLYET